jgi:thioredoxin
VTLAEFDAALAAADGPAIVDFWAPWCKPCEAIEPILAALPLPVVRVNLDDSPDVGGRFGVLSLPTVLLVEEGEARAEVLGAQPRERFERAFADWL